MTTLAGDLVSRVLRHARQGGGADVLASTIATGTALTTVTFTVTDTSKFGAPGIVEIGSELFLVRSYDRTTGTCTATRGWLGSTPAAHAIGDIIRINPRFYRRDALDAIGDAISKMTPPLFQIATADFTPTGVSLGFALPAAALDVYQVLSRRDATTNMWFEVIAYDFVSNMPAASFANGTGLIIGRQSGIIRNQPLRVLYKAPYVAPVDETSNMETFCGLQTFALDVPVWYAVALLVAPEEIARVQLRDAIASETAEQVPPASGMRAADYYRALYERSLGKAAAQLQERYPPRFRMVRSS